jgi:hypothetical protein
MDDVILTKVRVKASSAKDEILGLARAYNITYQASELDALGNTITRLAGDDGRLDHPGELLLALRRSGYITAAEATRLHGAYLRAKYE